jgi:hypothetical protein
VQFLAVCLKTLIYQRLDECVFRGNVAAQEILAGRGSAGDDRQKLHEQDAYPHLPGLRLQRFQFNVRLDAGEPAAPRTSAARSCNVF